MFTKASIFNMALGALLLQRQISDTENGGGNEGNTLRTWWDSAFFGALADMDLDAHSTTVTLELIEELDDDENWLYVYKYPTRAAFFRRIVSCEIVDDRATLIKKRVEMRDGVKVILTNEVDAEAEIIDKEFDLGTLTAPAAECIAYSLAMKCAPLIVGKGAKSLREGLKAEYAIAKGMAQELDNRENFNFREEYQESEFVRARVE